MLFLSLLISCDGNGEKIHPKVTSITESVYSSVTVQPDSLYQAFAVVNGIVDENLVEEGEQVQKGDPVVQIINSNPKLNEENAKITLELARRNLNGEGAILAGLQEEIEAARLKYINDSINFYRQKKLWAEKIGSKTSYESRKLAYEMSRAGLEQLHNRYARTKTELQTQLRQAENNYGVSKTNATDFTVSSKINGTVYALLKNAGEIVTINQPLASIGSTDNFVVEMLVDEVDIVKLKKGQPVLLTLDAYGSRIFKAKLSKIYPEKDERNQTFLVEAIFEEQPKVLYPGLSGEANIIVSQKDSALVIPRTYLIGTDKVKTENGFINVRTGLESIDSVEIVSGLTTEMEIYKPKEE
ncbi:MAG: HlyD family efflux transporter periplasmic adaptor subunit [Salinimicrobium sp.]